MALLGSSVDPRLFMQDYSGFTRAAEIQAQGMQNLGRAVGGAIEQVGDYFKQQGEKKKLIKKSDVQIDAALKLFPDLAPTLQNARDQIKDENVPLDDRAAIAESVAGLIDLGVGEMRNASNLLMQQQRLGLEQQYKAAQLGMRAEEIDIQRQKAAKGPAPKFELRRPTITSPTGEVFEGPEELPFDKSRGMFFDPKVEKYIANPSLIGTGQEYAPDSAMPTPTSQVMPSDGKFGFTYKTRDLLPASTPNARQISLDFNAAANKNAKGIEIIIPNNASDIERALALDYVNKTKDFFASKGVDVPVRGVRTAAENKRGSSNRFHTEPFFVNDAASKAAIESDPDGYAQVLASTIGKIPGAMFIAPHKSNDPGASANGINERNFAKSVLIPALERLSTQGSTASIGTPQQQAEVARMIEEGQGMAMAQNMPQGAIPTEPSMTTQQPQLPQQAAPQWSPPPGFAPRRVQYRDATKEEAARYGAVAGQIDQKTGRFYPTSQSTGNAFTAEIDPKTGKVVLTQGPTKAQQAAEAEAKAEQKAQTVATGVTQDLYELKNRYTDLSAGTGPIPALSRLGASAVPGTPAAEVKEVADRVTAGLTIENIMSARRSNAAGAALGGSTSDKDMKILERATTSLNAVQNPEAFNREWTRIMEAQLNIAYGTPEQRAKLVKENKITEEFNKQIEDLYPAETINIKGELVPRREKSAPNIKSLINPEVQAILDRFSKGQ